MSELQFRQTDPAFVAFNKEILAAVRWTANGNHDFAEESLAAAEAILDEHFDMIIAAVLYDTLTAFRIALRGT